MVLLEAGAARLPVVATDVGSVSDAVRDGLSGVLVPPGDPVALARAALHVLHLDAAPRRHMGDLGRAHVERHYGLDSVVDEWEGIYRGLLARRASQAHPWRKT